jgi:VanZ family protein
VVPGKMRPDILGNKSVEHFAAYFIAGGLFAIGYLRPAQRLSSLVLFVTCAGSLEFAQLWVPGRIASASDFAAGTLGAWIGLLLIIAARRAHERMFVVSYK